MASSLVLPYISSESEEDVTTKVTKQREVKRDRCWAMEKIYSNSKEAFDFVDLEKTWSFQYKNETMEGNKWYYRCNKAKLRGKPCQAGVGFFFR
jgi:hypothetical protein